jgi:hypothetical protein
LVEADPETLYAWARLRDGAKELDGHWDRPKALAILTDLDLVSKALDAYAANCKSGKAMQINMHNEDAKKCLLRANLYELKTLEPLTEQEEQSLSSVMRP